MDLNLATLSAMVRETLMRPREAATRLLAMNVPDDARWLAFVIVVVLSVILGQISVLAMGEGAFGGGMLFMAMFQTSVTLGMVVAVQGIGRMAGGKGTFPDTLLLIAWLQFVMLLFQLAQIIALVLVPPLFGLIAIAGLVVFLYMLTQFVLVLHGFSSAAKVFVGIIFSFFAFAMAMAIVLSVLGFGPEV